MLHNSQINRLLTSIVASMVVLSAVAHVEVCLPQQEVEIIANQLKCDCNELLSDRMGQEALYRLLRMGQRDRQENDDLTPAVTALHRYGGLLFPGSQASACPPHLLVPHHTQLYTLIYIPVDAALWAPATRRQLSIRAPSS